jgi:hypothetical protein
LNRATTLLKPHGLLVASIPNVAHADVRLALMLGNWDYRAYGILDDSHIRFFTLKSIKDLVRNAGLVITEMRRVRVPAFESELAIDRSAIATQVLDVILADPEAETYQFVFSAAIDNGDYRLNRISERMLELERNLDQERIAKHVLGTAYGSSDAVRLRQDGEIQRLNSELEQLLRTKTFRYSRPARNLYSWLRRRRQRP